MKKITAGLYFLYKQGELVYIGKSNNIFYRVGMHIHENAKDFDSFEYQIVEDENERSNLEGYLIEVFKPKYNEKLEPNNIFDKNKKHNYDYALDCATEAYEIINKYNWIPIKILDDIYNIRNIGFDLYNFGNLPPEVICRESQNGYTLVIDKTWVLQNIDYLTKEVERIKKL